MTNKALIDKFNPEKIKVVSLITLGRSSSFFLQGLMNSHPAIVTIMSVFYPEKKDLIQGKNQAINKLYTRINESFTQINTQDSLNNLF